MSSTANVLVTGGAGFIGSHVTEELIKRQYHVVVLDDLSGGFRDNVADGAEFVHGSVNDVQLVDRLFAEWRFDYVFHLAAYAAEGLSHFIKRFNYSNNLLGSVNLLNASITWDVKCFVFTSSIAAYGSNAVSPMTEEAATHPSDSYGIAKLAVEQELQACKEMFGLDSVIFRPHNVYGERQNIGDRYRNVVGIFMNQILQGRAMTVFGDGEQTRAFSYIADVAPLIARCIEIPSAYNQVFNVGADEHCSVNDLAHAVAVAMGVEPRVRHLPARPEVRHAHVRHEKLRTAFGYRSQWNLPDGLARMAHWVRQHGARVSKPFDALEVTKNFPQGWL